MIHKFLGRFRGEHLIDPLWQRVARGDGVLALEGSGIVANDAIVQGAKSRCVHELCEQVYRQEVERKEVEKCVPFALARNALAVFDVLVASQPSILIGRRGEDGMSLVTFCTLSSHLGALERLDAHLHVLGSCVREQAHDDPLYASCYSRLTQSTRWLLEHGMDPNRRDETGRCILHRLAVFQVEPPPDDKRSDSLEILRMLLAYGADPYMQDIHGRACINGQGWMCDQVRLILAEQSSQQMQAMTIAGGGYEPQRRF